MRITPPSTSLRLPLLAIAVSVALACAGSSEEVQQGLGDATTDGSVADGADAVDAGGTHGDAASPGPACSDACPDEEATTCAGAGVSACADHDDDGCLDWGPVVACPLGNACVDGVCAPACAGQACTALGAKRCSPDGAVESCGDFDGDGCLEWGAPLACSAQLVCSQGFCAVTCSDACTALGARSCEGDAVVTCGDHDGDGCLEFGQASSCGDDECVQGACQAICADDCTTEGSRRCSGNGVQTCGDYDGDGCKEWGTVVGCDPQQVCSNGACAETCQGECTVAGARRCALDAVETCGDYNGDGCLAWGTPVPCDAGLSCVAGGFCATTCQDQCTVKGARRCDEAGNVVECDDHTDDGCLEWGTPEQCAAGTLCDNGSCALACSDACGAAGDRRCVPGGAAQVEICGEHDGDGCLEWGTPEACEAGLVCAQGACEAACADACEADGAATCDGDAVVLCGDYNGDGCLEPGTPNPCDAAEACEAGRCEAREAPAGVVINELLYDSAGSPDVDAFVEIAGPPGTSLRGFTLVGVNGRDGGDYRTVTLLGAIGASGLYVIAHPDAAWDEDDVDQREAGADLQNAPDSAQLRFGDAVVDAVGYGTFSAGEVFAGEGAAAADAPTGQALARAPGAADTDDNASDFAVTTTPTPGRSNVITVPNRPPVARLDCPAGGAVGVAVEVDGSASSDPDGPIEEYTFSFGDGSAEVSGGAPTASHTYAATGTWTITLTVSDAEGARSADQCEVTITGDGGGDPGDTDQPPVARFTAAPTGGTSVTFDASASTDDRTAAADLEVRWDFEDDGGWDTGWSTDKAVSHDYPSATTWTARLEVRDGAGQTDRATRLVDLQDFDSVSGTIGTTTWSGTVLVLGDATVAEGETLTIAAGTTVLFLFADNGGGHGSNGLTVDGALVVEGTAEQPVIFSVRQAEHRRPRAWTGIEVRVGSVGTRLTGAIIEYADVGLNLKSGTTVVVDDSILRANRIGAEIATDATLDLSGSVIRDNLDEGVMVGFDGAAFSASGSTIAGNGGDGIRVRVRNSSVNLFAVTVADNGGHGAHVEGATFAAVDATFSGNGGAGVFAEQGSYIGRLTQANITLEHSAFVENLRGVDVRGQVVGSVTFSDLRRNRREGARLLQAPTSQGGRTLPSVVFHDDNIAGNSTAEGPVMERPDLAIATTSGGTGTVTSEPWTTAAAGFIEALVVQVGGNFFSSSRAAVYKDSTAGIALESWTSRFGPALVDVARHEMRTVVLHASDNVIGGHIELTVHGVLTYQAGATGELLYPAADPVLDATRNWWGDAGPDAGIIEGVDGSVDHGEARDAPVPGAGP